MLKNCAIEHLEILAKFSYWTVALHVDCICIKSTYVKPYFHGDIKLTFIGCSNFEHDAHFSPWFLTRKFQQKVLLLLEIVRGQEEKNIFQDFTITEHLR